jgi:Holliday junction resolvasome RuvABC endonuclease subunit
MNKRRVGMNILSLDLATKKTGYAIFADGILKDFGIMIGDKGNYQERILQIREKIIKKIIEFRVEHIVLEEVPMQQRNNLIVAHDLCVCQGVILDVCCVYGLGMKLYFPTSWRSIMGLYEGKAEDKKRDVQKQKSVEKANQIFNLDLKYFKSDSKKNVSDDDIAEAILLGLAYLKENV